MCAGEHAAAGGELPRTYNLLSRYGKKKLEEKKTANGYGRMDL